jgi:tetratricopeptide (TPR) repeat protein
MKSLISYCHANIHAKSESGVTPLIVALASGNDGNATFLVENSDSDDRNVILPGNVTVYHIAADMNLPHALRSLLLSYDEASSNTSVPLYRMKNERGESPLDLAVLSGNIQCVMMLLPKDHLGVNDETVARLFMRQRIEELKNQKSENSVGEDKEIVYKGQEKYLEHEVSSESDKVKEIYSIEDRAKRDAEQFAKMAVTEEQKIDGLQHKMKGNELFSKRFFADAIHEYTLAIEADPTDSAYYSNRSASYMSLKKYNEALYDAIICRSLKPDWAKGCYRLSAAQLALGKHEDAAVSAWEGVQLDNDNDELKCLLQKAVKLGNKVHKEQNAKIKGSDTLQTEDISSN